MPLFLLHAPSPDDAAWEAAIRVAAHRFPEVTLETRYAEHEVDREVWVCRAPSRDHLVRWAAAAALSIVDVRHVDAIHTSQSIQNAQLRQETP